ncbi:hypothetical protein H5410_019314 [Solanum commersonii]|uniref:Uncharacterized protein n=1 Tax=Solanum commersonii TaxID=4109 RepID=A0A9J5Z578_SOLCO|nr:hypothetical protein H5410_019314 [Solanum commersonii]
MDQVGPHSQNGPFSRSNDPRSSPWNFCDPKFPPHFFQNFTWTSVKTLAMEPVVHHVQNGSFSRLNDPQCK